MLIALDGLHPPSMGARVTFAGGKPSVADCPFPETKEVLGGYWLPATASNPRFTDESATCMIIAENIFAMLIVEVDGIVEAALAAGARRYRDPKDHGFIYEWGFEDLDGHIWEYAWMDPAAAAG